MSKKKKLLFSTIGLLIALGVFSTTAIIALANNSGYVKFKDAFFNTLKQTNMTIVSNFEIDFNGNILAKAYQKGMISEKSTFFENETYHINFGEEKNSTYIDDEEEVKYDKNNVPNNRMNNHSMISGNVFKELTDTQKKLIEIAVDTFLGDTKNYIITENNKITFNLQEYQVPQLAQAIVAVVTESIKINSEEIFNNTDVESKFFTYNDISIKNIVGSGEYTNDGFIKNFALDIELGGLNNNNYEYFKTSININVEDINNTIVVKPGNETY